MKEGWEIKKLGKVVEFQGGSQPPKSTFIYEPKDGYIRLLQIRDFKSDDKAVYIPISDKNRTCKSDDILIGRYGASVGKICTGKSGTYNVALMKATANSDLINSKYFLNYLNSNYFQKPLSKISDRSAQNGFNKDDIYNFEIPVPPLSEQERIVTKLDQCFEAIDKAKANVERNLQNAKELFQSQLNQIFSQKGEGWVEKQLGEVCEKTSNIMWQENQGVEFKYIDLTTVSRDSLQITETVTVNSTNAPSRAKKIIETNDVIFATTRPTLKRVAKITNQFDNQICSTGFVVLRSKKDVIEPEIIFYFLQTDMFMDRMESIQRGTSYPAATDKDVKETILPFPVSNEEQNNTIEKLDELRAQTQSLESHYQQELDALDELKKSILQKAFNGELTTIQNEATV